MGAGFFEKARADSGTWDLGLATNEGKLEELFPPAAYVVVGQLKLVKLPLTSPPSLIKLKKVESLHLVVGP